MEVSPGVSRCGKRMRAQPLRLEDSRANQQRPYCWLGSRPGYWSVRLLVSAQSALFWKELHAASAESEFASNWTWAGPWTYNHTS